MISPIIHRLDSTGSTNEVAAYMAWTGAPEGTVIMARLQTQGRGRRGRQWHAQAGQNLLMSVVLRPTFPAARFYELAFVAAVAVAGCLEECGVRVALKWPNDVLVDENKIAGILVETAAGAAIMGVGIDVLQCDFQTDLRTQPTSLDLCDSKCLDVDELADTLLRHLFSAYELPFKEILVRWRKYMWGLGRKVTVVTEEGPQTGIICGVADDGALELDDGRLRIVSAEAINVLRD